MLDTNSIMMMAKGLLSVYRVLFLELGHVKNARIQNTGFVSVTHEGDTRASRY